MEGELPPKREGMCGMDCLCRARQEEMPATILIPWQYQWHNCLDTNVIYLSLYQSMQDAWASTKNYKTHKKNETIFERQRNDPDVGSFRQGTLIAV